MPQFDLTMLKQTCIFLLCLLWNTSVSAQQQVTVSGTVTDVSGEPLPGVTVSVKSRQWSAATGAEGTFSLEVPAGSVLTFSMIGFKTLEVPAETGEHMKVTLEEDLASLDEVVVVGFGTQKKVNLTGAVSTVSSEDLASRTVGQASTALQGVAPGVTVTQRSGRPGGDGGGIRIRGIGTLNNAAPLVLIDGIEGSINNIDPNMIESVSVLKDAASSSIYGSRAANGVILVTTKRAKSGELSINYSGYTGWQNPTNLPDMVGAVDHMLMTNEAYVNTGRDPLYSDELIEAYRTEGPGNPDQYPDTDWQKEVLTGSGLMQNHLVSLNGGGENIRFLTSLSYFDQKGIIPASGFKRYTLRNNADIRFSDKWSMKLDIQLMSETEKEPGRGTAQVFHWMNRIPANQPGVFSDGTWGEGWNGANPIAFSRQGGFREYTRPEIFLNASLNYQPADGLQLELKAAPKYAHYFRRNFYESVRTYNADGSPAAVSPAQTTLTEENSRSFYHNFWGTVTYDKAWNDHGIRFMAGASYEDYRNRFTSAFRDGYVLSGYPVLDAGSAENQQNSGNAAEWGLLSFFGRVNYDYKQKYLLEVNGRYDGSSRFARGNKFGFYPSVSAGWRLSEESFMASLHHVVNELKIRGSWGRLGNQLIGNYPFTTVIDLGEYTFDNEIVDVAALNTMANPGISWETTEMFDIGLDLVLFSKLTITADYYQRRTRDILFDLDIPLIVGLNKPFQNVGVVDNKGWDLEISYRGAVREFNYDISVNLSDVKNEVIDLQGVNRTGLTVNWEGYPINSIYGYESEGFFQSDEEVAAHATQFGNVSAGDIKYKDQNEDGIINDADAVIIGSTIPRYTFGTRLHASYKGFDLQAFFQGVGKADGYLYQQGIMPFFNGGTVQEQHKDHWTPENPDAAFARLAFSEPNNEQNSSFWLKDASYLRLKTLALGYRIPEQLAGRLGVKGLRLYANAQNLFTLDNFWKGYDVEAPVGRGDEYPQVKVYSFGLDINF